MILRTKTKRTWTRGLISRRYAKALLKFAQDRGTTDQIYEEVKKFEENFLSRILSYRKHC